MYPVFDWFDAWHEIFVHARLAIFCLDEAKKLEHSTVIFMPVGGMFDGQLLLNGSPDVEYEDVFLCIGMRRNGVEVEAYFECHFGRGQPSFFTPSLLFDQMPEPKVFSDLFLVFFESSFAALLVNKSWIEAIHQHDK